MPVLADRLSARAISVEFVGALIRVVLTDGREISAPLAGFPRLRGAPDEQRANWRLIGQGEGVHWRDIDEDVSVNAMLGLPTSVSAPNRPSRGHTHSVYERLRRSARPVNKPSRISESHRLDLAHRPRRNRKAEWARRLVAENVLTASDLIWPLFLVEGKKKRVPVAAMPGVDRLSVDEALRAAERAVKLDIPAIAFFPYTEPHLKDEHGSEAFNEDNLVCKACRAIKREFPALGLVTDVALDPYTSHGHDGLVSELKAGEFRILNDETVEALVRQALNQARAGADVIAPSDMMDGRVGAIREALDAEGFLDVQIMAYSAKYASAFYGPFRDALGSAARSKATSAPIRWTRPTATRRCARSGSISTRAPTW